jgi:hypothetical protein
MVALYLRSPIYRLGIVCNFTAATLPFTRVNIHILQVAYIDSKIILHLIIFYELGTDRPQAFVNTAVYGHTNSRIISGAKFSRINAYQTCGLNFRT